ncbi:NmrA family transcriptional regulator [Mycobacterium heckeshornense]|uniref:Nucleotide-diphosphate-sugar epimerase n=1 Tax=Mycobacterium heckeshornense TaxID=110505 RepID=A0A2G8B9R9_9MYCO|nr:NAD(P)H-binding protein [Mycobacterium heckeshornense]KMV24042.1 NmrA family transcriptional regulator [Mycobacterium heckeshornense]MCV7033377.1 NAD(P)H-binding protein [Mycobacterium heckeshornense]PIJ34510.1 NmrA family transcriptional regulator [Mycobacterium heckeshornense]BCO34602.1 nucleotide-diphosphate-sugar epimerase [Mycobacterium heckeshornense]
MAELILVTGGTGTVGRVVSERLLDAGAQVRVLSRGLRSIGRTPHVVGDVRTGEGLAEAIRGVDTIVHCVDPAHHVVDAALAAGKPHVVFISIVGVDRVPLGYYRRKLADEQLIMDSGLPWTVLRATQFHDLIAAALRMLATPPILMVPAGWRVQPIDVREVGARLAELALDGPAGRVADMGGPEVLPIAELARRYLAAVGKRRPVVSLPLPGRISRGYRSGGNLTPEHAVGTIPFERYLDEQLAAGRWPYSEAIRSYLRLPRRFRSP